MKPEDIHLHDIMRIIVGDVPGSFLIEVVIRITFVFFLLIFSMRMMGRRMSSTLSRNELAALVSLAAAIGVPIQVPERGLLPALIIACIVIGMQRLIAIGTFKSKKFEHLTQGRFETLVKDGCLNLEALEKTGLSRERLFGELRAERIDNLGRVQRVYLEASGRFSILEHSEPGPGLPILPDWDDDFTTDQTKIENLYTCGSCGNMVENQQEPEFACSNCYHTEWKPAVQC